MVIRKPVKPGEVLATPCKPAVEPPESHFATKSLDAYDPTDIRFIFVSPPKYVVGTTVPESVYFKLLDYKGGISQFFTDAVTSFDGDLGALAEAAARLAAERKRAREESPVRTANGRVSKEIYTRIVELERALVGVRQWSRAKVLAGLIQLKLFPKQP